MAADPLRFKVGRGTVEVPWSRLDRAIQSFAPQWAAKRLQSRVGFELAAQMGGYNGASKTRRSLAGWNPLSSDADSDGLPDLHDLRARTRDLSRNSPVAGGATNTTITHVVGTGLALLSSVDAELLGLSDDEAEDWQQDTERKFNNWFESTDCDITRHQTGYGLQALVLRSECESGDVLVPMVRAPWAEGPVQLALQVVEADRVCNPDRRPDTATMVAGVNLDPNGAATGYHVASSNPHHRAGHAARRPLTWTELPAFGGQTGRRQVLHIFERRRPGQTRGIPMLAPVIEPLKQLERYTEAELMAAVISGMFTVFVKTEGSGQASITPSALTGGGGAGASGQSSRPTSGGWNGQLGNGLVVDLDVNESIETANPGRPNAQFDPFVSAIIKQIGLVLEIPYEVLMKHYSSSYSAARAALLDAWRSFRQRRARLAEQFCQPVFEAWMDEAVATGYITAPGYFASPLIRRAWLGAMWIGDGPMALDPAKEVDAAERRVELGISTREAESLLHDGGKLRNKVRQLLREQKLMKDLVKTPRAGAAAPVPGAPASPNAPPQPEPDLPDDQEGEPSQDQRP